VSASHWSVPIPPTFPERLRLLRAIRGLKQGELAEQIGLRQDAVAQWETGRRYPRADVLATLARTLGTTAEILASGGHS
jgi:transcriptional regulator with XRE-family HTH domain